MNRPKKQNFTEWEMKRERERNEKERRKENRKKNCWRKNNIIFVDTKTHSHILPSGVGCSNIFFFNAPCNTSTPTECAPFQYKRTHAVTAITTAKSHASSRSNQGKNPNTLTQTKCVAHQHKKRILARICPFPQPHNFHSLSPSLYLSHLNRINAYWLASSIHTSPHSKINNIQFD